MSVHAAVPEVVWWPANIMEMNMPVTMSVENLGPPVLVADRHEDVEKVAVVVGGRRPVDPAVHDGLDQIDQTEAGRVAAVEGLDVGIGVDVGEGVGALLEVVVEPGEAPIEVAAELRSDETGRGRVDGELGEPVEQVDGARRRTSRPPWCPPRRRWSRRGRA